MTQLEFSWHGANNMFQNTAEPKPITANGMVSEDLSQDADLYEAFLSSQSEASQTITHENLAGFVMQSSAISAWGGLIGNGTEGGAIATFANLAAFSISSENDIQFNTHELYAGFFTQPPAQAPAYQMSDVEIQNLLDSGEDYVFSFNAEQYTLRKDMNSGRYMAFNAAGDVVDSAVQIQNGLTVAGFVEVGGLPGLDSGDRLYIGMEPSGTFSMIIGPASLDAHRPVNSQHGSHLAQLLQTGTRVVL